MSRTEVTGRVVYTERLRSSKFGNPRFLVSVEITEGEYRGETRDYRTEPDASLAYGIENRDYRDNVHRFTINGRGNIETADYVHTGFEAGAL